jgi:hypothetical protein
VTISGLRHKLHEGFAMTDDDRTVLMVRVTGKERLNEVCSVLRGLLHANHQSDGQTKTNKQFAGGVEIEFGAAPAAEAFIESVKAVLKRKVRNRVTLERRA